MLRNYDRLMTLSVEEGMAAIKDHISTYQHDFNSMEKRVDFKGLKVKLGSLRLRTFEKSGVCCVECNLKATHFAFEKNPVDVNYHINLWGVNDKGEEILFTHDHILARSLGGADNIKNTQTMCCVCNFEKGRGEQKILLARKSERQKTLTNA